MKPILFSESATTFTTNGLGRLDCISCKVTEERNGIYELEAVIAEGSQHYSELAMSKIIAAKPFDGGSLQPFRIYKITKPIGGKSTVYAQHISYQLSYIPTMPFSVTASSTACSQTLAALKSNAAEACPFTFWTDVTTVASYHHDIPSSIRQRLGGIEGSVLDQFGGEYEFDNYAVKLHKNRGVTIPTVTLRYGKNITDLEQEEYISNTITGVCPFWRSSDGTKVVTLPEKVIESTYAGNYPFRRTVPLDLSQHWDEAPTAADLRATATAAVQEDGVGIPTVSIKVSFIPLWQTEEYKDIAPLQRVKLCDRVNVQFEKLGISTTAKVVKTVYDVLQERYESVEIGSMRTSLAQAITDTNEAITAALEKTTFDVRNATAWLTSSNGYVVAVKNADGTWKELLFMDSNDTATAHNVLRINENGLGFSSTGVNGPYTQAWTLDGRLVVGGTNVPSLTVYDSNNNVLFQISRSGMVWNATNSSMTANGTLTATNAVLTGSITVKNGSTTLFSATPTGGVIWTATNSSMDSTGKITASSAVLNSATIKNSSVTDSAVTGSLTVKDGNNTLFSASPSGVVWNATNSSMDLTGKITANSAVLDGSLTVKNGNSTLFKAAPSDGVIWNATNSSMDRTGKITASSAVLNSATIKNSSVTDSAVTGSLTVKDGYNTLFSASPSGGVVWNATNSSMTSTGKITASSAVLNSATINNSSVTDSAVTGSLTVKDGYNTLFSASPSGGVVWNATNSSMDSTGKITANNALIKGEIKTNEDSSLFALDILENKIYSMENGQRKSTFISAGSTLIELNVASAGSSDGILHLKADSIYLECNSLSVANFGSGIFNAKDGRDLDIVVGSQTLHFKKGILVNA